MTTNSTTTRTLNLERMTSEYFYPNVFVDDFTDVKIPTVSELLFLGVNNVHNIRMFLRGEEKKLRRVQNEIRKSLKELSQTTPSLVQKKCTKPNGQAVSCNWRGMGYSRIPEELEDELLQHSDVETYCKVQNKRARKVYTCRFGKEVAAWCKNNPQPCTNLQCYQMVACNDTAIANTSGDAESSCEDQPSRCPRYTECYGTHPFVHRECIFAAADEKMLEDCESFLQERINIVQRRLDFIDKYLQNITKAVAYETAERPRPSFSLNSRTHMFRAESGNRIVGINSDGKVAHGIFVCLMEDEKDGKVFLLNMQDGRVVKLPTAVKRTNASWFFEAETLYMLETDFNYLKENPDFCKVWIRMAGDTLCDVSELGVVKALATK